MRGARVGIAAVALACTPSGLGTTTVWSEPAIAAERVHRIMTVFVTEDDELRRVAELDMARRVGNGVPAYLVVSTEHLSNEAWVRRRIRQSGLDGAMIARLVDVGPADAPAPANGSPNGSHRVLPPWTDGGSHGFWGYWSDAWTASETDRAGLVRVETALYSIAPDRLLWTGRSGPIQRATARAHVTDVVSQAAAEMRRRGVY